MSTGPEPPVPPTTDGDAPQAPPPEASVPDPTEVEPPDGDDYGPPFETRSFGGEFVWADTPAYTAKILRVRPGENVIVSTQGRCHMYAMLTGGRGVLEIRTEDGVDRVELLPASPISILPNNTYRLLALTEVELHTIYAPA
jgi:hypothetical protein